MTDHKDLIIRKVDNGYIILNDSKKLDEALAVFNSSDEMANWIAERYEGKNDENIIFEKKGHIEMSKMLKEKQQ